MIRPLLITLCVSSALSGAEHQLKASPDSIAWGNYWAGAKPLLTVMSGDTVEIQTVSGDPPVLERAGVPADQIQPELRKIRAGVPKELADPAAIC